MKRGLLRRLSDWTLNQVQGDKENGYLGWTLNQVQGDKENGYLGWTLDQVQGDNEFFFLNINSHYIDSLDLIQGPVKWPNSLRCVRFTAYVGLGPGSIPTSCEAHYSSLNFEAAA
jgi:hypothetical protein